MSDEIRADYGQLEQVAGKFASQMQAVEDMMQKVMSGFESLENGGWIGRGSEAFISEMRSEVIPAATRFIEALNEGQQVTRQIAQVMKHAEEEASSRFRM